MGFGLIDKSRVVFNFRNTFVEFGLGHIVKVDHRWSRINDKIEIDVYIHLCLIIMDAR